ncbi:hypothetical protein BGZ65_012498, partial [Modicella reniformis]
VLTGGGTVPRESMILTIALCILGVLNVLIRANSPAIPVSMLVGWTAGAIWKRLSPKSHERLMYSVSAGLIAGVGIAGLVTAAFTIGGISGKNVQVGCGGALGLCD